jgi:aminopeptidase
LPIKGLQVESKNTDLYVEIGKNRKWLGLSGHNIPSFEIFTSPDYRGTKGRYFANVPSYNHGTLVDKVNLDFADGKVIISSAASGEKYLKNQLSLDPGASRIGEFSLTDKRFSRIDKYMAATIFDENFGGEEGNCHIAVGGAYLDAINVKDNMTKTRKKELGVNDSSIHWDLISTEKRIVTAYLQNGKKQIIYENGMFKV